MKLRLTSESFSNYTGQMGVIYFENGLSKHDVHPNDAIRIAGSIGAEWENGEPANVGDIYTQNLNTPAPSIEQQSGMHALQENVGGTALTADQAINMGTAVAHAQINGIDENSGDLQAADADQTIHPEQPKSAGDAPSGDEGADEATEAANAAPIKYTAESLAAIADESGIAGLREIGKSFGVTGNSIATLTERILQKQG